MTPEPILVDCDGSGVVATLGIYSAAGTDCLMTRCPVCGNMVGVTGAYYEGTLTAPAWPAQVLPHQCWDILAMIERGDFS